MKQYVHIYQYLYIYINLLYIYIYIHLYTRKSHAAQWLEVVSDESEAFGASKAAKVGSSTVVLPEVQLGLDLALSFKASSAKVHSSTGFS